MSRYATYEPPEEATAYLRQASPTRSFIPVLLSLAALYLGPNVLMALGYPILDPGSGPLFRIHPLTYLLLALFFVQLLLRNFRLGILLSNRSVKWYFLISLLVFGYSLMGSSASNGYFLDTFVNAFILVYLFGYYPDQARKACWFALQLFFFTNCALAIGERVMETSIFPRGPEPSYVRIFRSTAFQGYCLNNAFIIGSMAVFFIAYYRSLAMKSLFYGTALLAMLSFGARGALAGLTVGFVLILFYELRYFSGMRKANRLGLYLLLLSLVGAAGVYLVTSTPFGERFMQVSYNDDSAEVRMDVYNLLDRVNTQDLLWGMSQSDIDTAMNLEGIGIIENFWIVWIFKYGILMTIALGISVFFFLMQVLKPVRKPVRLIILAVFFMIGSGNNSLSTSTMCLNILVLCGLSVLPGYKSSENILEGSHTPYGYLYSEHDYSTEPE